MLITLSLSSVGMVQGSSRKLLAPTFPDFGSYDFPLFPPVTDWPEYKFIMNKFYYTTKPAS
ncbi:hypothetical protein AHAS_Ahas09G0216400 [Arachis hypogaea]